MICRLTAIFILLLGMLLTSCSSRSLGELDRPSTEPTENAQMKDPSMRISGSPLTLNYDDGGILFSRSTDGIISAVRVSDGVGFEYNPASEPPSLLINGVPTTLSSAELIKTDGATEWYKLILSNPRTEIYIVITL